MVEVVEKAIVELDVLLGKAKQRAEEEVKALLMVLETSGLVLGYIRSKRQ